ncbi:MAG: malto-oligosyltrehalose synthase, partial [Anaerolineae bacterium]|nr:malto-oligosyltrehalose synthase [Anaerolineae bacterium]
MTLIEKIFDSRRIPRATYRLQFNEQFTFRDAIQIIPYLHQMGISDLYASPLLKARPGSTHGYDTCDYSQLNPVLGTEADFEDMTAALQQHNMGLLLDIVPNHMGVGAECNRWWMDVLEHGPSSIYAAYFDINWRPVKREMADRVLLPILEDHYGVVLEDGKLNLDYQDGAFCLFYGETRLPITPDTYPLILQPALETVSAESETTLELQSILTALQYLPVYTDTEKSDERQRESQIIKRRLAVLMESAEVQTAVQQVVEKFNGVAGEAASFDMLDHLLNGQPYRLAFWRVAADEINYRRFFDINDMAAVQVEVPEVFAAVHDKILMLLANGQVTGLRIDHPDGLWHPAAYFRQIQESYLIRRIQAENPMEGVDTLVSEWADSYEQQPEAVWPVYIVAEKILSETEPLPHEWAVNGTTGYDFLNLVNGLFVQPERAALFTEIYERFVDHPVHFDELVYEAKHLIMDQALSSEIRTLSHRLERITESSRRYRDFTLTGIRGALREVIASMSIYRTYITAPETISDRDRRYLIEAVLNARRRNPDESRLLFSFIRDTLLLNNLDNFPKDARTRLLNFVMKFQQLTGPVMAKSFEDTTFYIYNRLVSLNEVGGHPQEFGISLEHFHQQTQERAKDWPHSLLASSTHDTKRSEDVRARLNVLSEIPDLWEAAVQRWSKQNAPKKRNGQPDANDEYLFYQVLLGIWGEDNPEDIQARLTMYMIKAANEAKV